MADDWLGDKQIQIHFRVGEPDTNIDPEDQAGSGWRAGTPDAYRWVLTERSGEGPRESHKPLKTSERWFSSSEEAEEGARQQQEQDPELQGIPIRRV
jgi:hypothetical protein